MEGCNLVGTLPKLGNLSNLELLILSTNKLSNKIPNEIFSLPKLTTVYLNLLNL